MSKVRDTGWRLMPWINALGRDFVAAACINRGCSGWEVAVPTDIFVAVSDLTEGSVELLNLIVDPAIIVALDLFRARFDQVVLIGPRPTLDSIHLVNDPVHDWIIPVWRRFPAIESAYQLGQKAQITSASDVTIKAA